MSEALRLPALGRRHAPMLLVGGAVVFALLYVLVIAQPPGESNRGSWRTTNFGSAVDDPASFLRILLDSITFAGALFIVASGFALIFGLMRVVNMAHGSFYLLSGYIAYEIQQTMTGQGFAIPGSEVNTWEWLVPLVVAAPSIAVVGLVVQQAFLRWNQGQELRQALITIAISVIIADQIIAHFPRSVGVDAQPFGGNQVQLTWPGWTEQFLDIRVAWGWTLLVWLAILAAVALGIRELIRRSRGVSKDRASLVGDDRAWRWKELRTLALGAIALFVLVDIVLAYSGTARGWIDAGTSLHSVAGVSYSVARLVILAIGVAVGVGLWVWLYRTKTGMIIRAGVDDQKMASALGINIQKTFAIAFVVGSALAALGAVVWGSQAGVASGEDGRWLLNSLVVVIVGGMGSIFGAAAGAILFAVVSNFTAAYLPSTGDLSASNCCTQYSIVFTFILIALVLSFRPQGLFGRPG